MGRIQNNIQPVVVTHSRLLQPQKVDLLNIVRPQPNIADNVRWLRWWWWWRVEYGSNIMSIIINRHLIAKRLIIVSLLMQTCSLAAPFNQPPADRYPCRCFGDPYTLIGRIGPKSVLLCSLGNYQKDSCTTFIAAPLWSGGSFWN